MHSHCVCECVCIHHGEVVFGGRAKDLTGAWLGQQCCARGKLILGVDVGRMREEAVGGWLL